MLCQSSPPNPHFSRDGPDISVSRVFSTRSEKICMFVDQQCVLFGFWIHLTSYFGRSSRAASSLNHSYGYASALDHPIYFAAARSPFEPKIGNSREKCGLTKTIGSRMQFFPIRAMTPICSGFFVFAWLQGFFFFSCDGFLEIPDSFAQASTDVR